VQAARWCVVAGAPSVVDRSGGEDGIVAADGGQEESSPNAEGGSKAGCGDEDPHSRAPSVHP